MTSVAHVILCPGGKLYNAYRLRWKTFMVTASCSNSRENFHGCVILAILID